jgi:hypothetical protein
MVSRPTWNMGAMPCGEMRSASARSMAACFSGVRARLSRRDAPLMGDGVKVFLQPRQRQRAVPVHLPVNPLRLVPNLMTSFLLPQCGHDKATIAPPYSNNAVTAIA